MRRWIACCALLLSACLISEPPQIPQSELVQPADLAGRYWALPLQRLPQDLEPWLVEFRSGPDGQMVHDDGASSPNLVRLVELNMPGVYLCIRQDTDGGPGKDIKAIYHLLVRRDLGVWDEFDIDQVRARGAFGKANLVHLQAIAARHGLSLDASDTEATLITGNVHGTAIPGLFRDRDFLAALELKPFVRYLPQPPAAVRRERLMFLPGTPSIPFVLDQPDLPGAQWVRPSGFVGDYDRAVDGPHFLRILEVRIRQLPDGRFEKAVNGSAQMFGLLSLGAEPGPYLWVSFDRRHHLDRSHDFLTLSILRRNERGWTVEPVLLRRPAAIAGRQDLLSEQMNMAATRQGLSLDRYELKGGTTARALLALLNDGQFTIGLIGDRSSAERYAPREAARNTVPLTK